MYVNEWLWEWGWIIELVGGYEKKVRGLDGGGRDLWFEYVRGWGEKKKKRREIIKGNFVWK